MIFGEAAARRGGGLVLFLRQAGRQPPGPRARPAADALPVTSEFDERARTQDDKPGRRKEDLRAAVVIMGG